MAEKSMDYVSVSQDYFIGMPQLALGGLSENWLLKECGHQHWLALAKRLDLPTPNFVDQQGRHMYAAFLVVKISYAALHQVTENSRLWIETQLTRVSPSRSYSCHDLYLEEGDMDSVGMARQPIAQVALLSSFVSRSELGNNQSVARGEMAKGDWFACEAASQMMAQHKVGRTLSDVALSVSERPFLYQPCPYADFNGADFLYFAQFQAVIDRAERFFQSDLQALNHTSERNSMALWQTVERTICYYGNINLDDGLEADLYVMPSADQDSSLLSHCGRLYRQSDHALIANVITRKRYLDHSLVRFQEKQAGLKNSTDVGGES
ncbi:Pnap_2097 family protein [Marinomonas sp.]|uniref:Pnap_2097 family protein n=1 Tax=Marinomonas sp. TaxID=1904862 RepID=UPI003BAA3296